jgi:hypothetical protein
MVLARLVPVLIDTLIGNGVSRLGVNAFTFFLQVLAPPLNFIARWSMFQAHRISSLEGLHGWHGKCSVGYRNS